MSRYSYEAPDGSRYQIEAADDIQASAIMGQIAQSLGVGGKPPVGQTETPGASGPVNPLLPGFEAALEAGINTIVNPRAATRMAVQGIGTAAGAAAGTPAGLPGQIMGGGLGNLTGRIISSAILGENAPTLGEGAVDTLAGAAGPAAGPVMSAVARPAARVLTGTTGQAGRERLKQQASDLFWGRVVGDEAGITAARQRAQEIARASAQRVAGGISKGANVGSLGYLVGTGDIVGAMALWASGRGLRSATRRGVEAGLQNPRFVQWLVNHAPNTSRRQIARAVAGSIAEGTTQSVLGLSPEHAQAFVDSAPAPVFQRGSGMWHDPDSGRIIGRGTVMLDGFTYVQGERVRRATQEDMNLSRAPDPEIDPEE